MVMLVLELSAGRYLLKMNLAPWEQCRMDVGVGAVGGPLVVVE
ncbi:Uncharacterised protein [Mycobacterium tuberculosis]|nr:Uncharacterised protein [Mycobacterium tuberculosis]